MNKRKDIKKAMCQYDEKRNIKGSDKVLRSNRNNFYTLDEVINLIKDIANITDK